MVELEKSLIIFGDNPVESEFSSDILEHTEALFAPRIEVPCPDHGSFMTFYRFEDRLDLPEKWLPKVKVHRMGIHDEELLTLSADFEETDTGCFRGSEYWLSVNGWEDPEHFLSIF